MVSHLNVIANILQVTAVDSVARKQLGVRTQTNLGVLPFSHIYGLTLVALVAHYRGDQVVVLPKFEPATFLDAIQRFSIEQLSVVPPMLIHIITNREAVSKHDLSSVRFVYCGAAPLGTEVIEGILKLYPNWNIGQGYGMTEASPVVVSTSEVDRLVGSSGCLVPGSKAKVIDADGNQVTAHETRGELFVQSPSIALGYLHNEKANAETFVHHEDGRWLRTGDEVLVRKSAQGTEHFVITDRIKELIKVKVPTYILPTSLSHTAATEKDSQANTGPLLPPLCPQGHQVAPAELEAHLLSHPFVSDCTVIPVPDLRAGEVPKAYVVKARESSGRPDAEIALAIRKHVEDHKARHKWLRGGVEFIDAIPKSPSGKILRRLLKDKEKEKATPAKL
ncbi:phenylacetyl-CoA ligase [Metarhizium album ARSEF 1941]|uniref:Phenylacetyl-CoA ligase n=1 Tax=Metarhizium album (strain ARSEF 1941) TaxID=1081103 RepID=A0A0B2WZ47_METAS|nr:phenylacetyl-CoA ligase [Metarhizium album ARSEF 1941]KHN98707.1 phenylacetyl-CoA ligase [Metarhizium album ARSEF 1941]